MPKIITYNVNGIRAAMRKGLVDWMKTIDADVVCLQEIKAMEDQFDLSVIEDLGYHCYLYSAQKKGYSGVAIFSKEKPKNIVYGCGKEKFDFEGRMLRLDFKNYSVLTAYHPSGTNPQRLSYKFEWMAYFYEYIQQLDIKNLVINGDFNVCHKAIDLHNPRANKNTSGFLPQEREWFTQLLNLGFVDSFREVNQEPDNYTWWSYMARARDKNLGWRLDYHLVSSSLQERIKRVVILKMAYHSDHCPVLLELTKI